MSLSQTVRLIGNGRTFISSSCKNSNLLQHQSRQYARMTLIGNLVQDARVIDRGNGKEPMVAIKVATTDPLGREARESGREPTSSFHDILSFSPGLNKYLAEYKKGSLVHVEADVRMQPQGQVEPGIYQPSVVRLTLREINKLRNPKSD